MDWLWPLIGLLLWGVVVAALPPRSDQKWRRWLAAPEIPGILLAVVGAAEALLPTQWIEQYRWPIFAIVLLLAIWFAAVSIRARLDSESRDERRNEWLKTELSDLRDAAKHTGESLGNRVLAASTAIFAILNRPKGKGFELAQVFHEGSVFTTELSPQQRFDGETVSQYIRDCAAWVCDLYSEVPANARDNDLGALLRQSSLTVSDIEKIAEGLGQLARRLPE